MDITVRIRLIKGDNVLLILEREGKEIRKADGTKFIKPGGCGLPGGRKKADELPYEAAVRELREETGLVADIEPEPSKIIASRDGTHEIWLFAAKNPQGDIYISDPYAVAAKWIDWKLTAYGSVMHQGKEIPIYITHMPLI